MFTKQLKNHIGKSGWFPNRKISKYDDFMQEHEYPEFIKEFVQEYGELTINKLNNFNSEVTNKTILDIQKSDGMDSESVSEDYSNDLEKKLYVIGIYSPENFDIAVDANGAVYLLGEYCWCMGKNLFEGIESIIRVDQWPSLELNPKDTKSKIWTDTKGRKVDFDSHQFNYKAF